MTYKELDKKYQELNVLVASLKMKFLEAKQQGDKKKRLEIRAQLRAKQKERNYYKKQAKLAKIVEGK